MSDTNQGNTDSNTPPAIPSSRQPSPEVEPQEESTTHHNMDVNEAEPVVSAPASEAEPKTSLPPSTTDIPSSPPRIASEERHNETLNSEDPFASDAATRVHNTEAASEYGLPDNKTAKRKAIEQLTRYLQTEESKTAPMFSDFQEWNDSPADNHNSILSIKRTRQDDGLDEDTQKAIAMSLMDLSELDTDGSGQPQQEAETGSEYDSGRAQPELLPPHLIIRGMIVHAASDGSTQLEYVEDPASRGRVLVEVGRLAADHVRENVARIQGKEVNHWRIVASVDDKSITYWVSKYATAGFRKHEHEFQPVAGDVVDGPLNLTLPITAGVYFSPKIESINFAAPCGIERVVFRKELLTQANKIWVALETLGMRKGKKPVDALSKAIYDIAKEAEECFRTAHGS